MAACAVSKYDKNISRGLGGNLEESTVTGRPQLSCMRCKVELERNLWDRRTFAADTQGCGKPHLKPQRLSPSFAPPYHLRTLRGKPSPEWPPAPPSLTLCQLTRADALLARICPPSSCVPIDYPNGIVLLCGESVSVLHQCAASSSAKILHHHATQLVR